MSYGTVRLERGFDGVFSSVYPSGRTGVSITVDGVVFERDSTIDRNGRLAALRVFSESFRFDTSIKEQNRLGYGFGAFYNQDIASQVTSHKDSYTLKDWVFASQQFHPDPWKVGENANGYRFMRCAGIGGKDYNFYYDNAIQDDEIIYTNRSVRAYAFNSTEPDPQSSIQWKSIRNQSRDAFSQGQNINSVYPRGFYYNPVVANLSVWYYSDQARQRVLYPCRHPGLDQIWTMQDVNIYTGHFDTEDGSVRTGTFKEGEAYGVVYAEDNGVIGTGQNIKILDSINTDVRIDSCFFEDYIDNASTDQWMEVGDTFTQVGSASHIKLGNGTTPENSTELVALPLKVVSDTHIVFPLWSGIYDSVESMSIFYYGKTGELELTLSGEQLWPL
jgi:hypothetical protein